VSYPLGWSLATRMGVRRERWPGGYDLKCAPLVHTGAHVEPSQPVMHIVQIERSPLASQAPRLALPASSEQSAPIVAGLRGTVVAVTSRGSVVIEGLAAVVGGTVGAGRQVAGTLTLWQPPDAAEGQASISPGAILVVPGPLTLTILRRALYARVAGVIASSIALRDLETFLCTDLIDLLNCLNPELLLSTLPPLTILLTEGLGTIAMPVRTINLCNKHQGVTALLSGMTSLSAHIFPELLIPLSAGELRGRISGAEPDVQLRPGALVRVCSGSYAGTPGNIDYLFSHQQLFPSGIRARAARIRLEDGSLLIVPLSVLERIG
jgi:hypothetical protein